MKGSRPVQGILQVLDEEMVLDIGARRLREDGEAHGRRQVVLKLLGV